MKEFFLITLQFIAQFTGGHGKAAAVVNYGIGTVLFGALLSLAIFQRQESANYREKILIWGFGIGLIRELFMILISYLQAFELLSPDILYLLVPPLEHGLSNIAMVVIAAAFLQHLLKDNPHSRLYLKYSLISIIICYLIIFSGCFYYIINNPNSRFDQPWYDWLFRVNASIWMLVSIVWLLAKSQGWTRNAVCLALTCFFLSEFIIIPEIILGDSYTHILTPISHGLYMIAIPIFGFVYIREMYIQRQMMLGELNQSKLTLEAIFQNSIPTSITSTDYQVLHANDSYFRVFGDEHRENNKCYLSRPGSLCHSEKCPMKQILNGKKSLTIDSTKQDNKGKERHFIITAKPYHNPEGDIVGIVESYQDITRRKIMEQEREEMESLLRQSQKMEALGTMAGGIAHDFNNMLFITIGNAEMSLDDIPTNNPARDKIEQILKISSRGQDLVKQILTFSRRESHELKPHYLQLLLDSIQKILRPIIPATVRLNAHIAKDCPPVISDSTQISQLLMNLCNNAVHAMDEEGTIELTLKNIELTREDLKDQPTMEPGLHVRLSVSDNGSGIDSKKIARIFEPFYTTKEIGVGTGMGLSVVHGIVIGHKARILVDSEPGTGTTFRIDFPTTEVEQEVEQEPDIELLYGTERILFVDDEEALAVMAGMMLEQIGYKVTIKTNSNEALQLFRLDPTAFDLIITDQTMPELSGIELAKKIMAIRPAIPVILCTGYSKKISREKALNAGIKEFCLKPLHRNQFTATVRIVLDNAAMEA